MPMIRSPRMPPGPSPGTTALASAPAMIPTIIQNRICIVIFSSRGPASHCGKQNRRIVFETVTPIGRKAPRRSSRILRSSPAVAGTIMLSFLFDHLQRRPSRAVWERRMSSMSRPLYFYSQALLGYNMGPQHPMRPERLRMTHALLDAYGLFEHALELAPPELADEEEVEETHSRDFLEALSSLDRGDSLRNPYRYGLGTGDNPIFPGIYEASLRYTGGSLGAAQAVLDGASVAFNMAGGLHHAHYDRAAGFCVLNDCAVGIRRLRRKFSRVAYVDIDVHHGDGVQESFYSDPTVLTVSLQEVGRAFFPGTGYVEEIGEGAGEGYSVNVPFAPYTPGDIWLQGW